ncbi:major facilitator superfamily domain-containing protein, partial [Gigaspora rosea]
MIRLKILADRYDAHRKIMISCTICIMLAFWSIPFTGKYLDIDGLFISVVIYSIFDGGVVSLIDNLTINVLSRKEESTKFGRQRLFGTISWGITSAALGFIIDGLNSYYVLFFAFGFFIGLFLLVLYLIPVGDFKVADDIDLVQLGSTSNEVSTQIVDVDDIITAPPPPFMKAILKLITKPRLLLFLFVILLTNTVKSSITTFLYVFLTEDRKADAKLLGLSTSVGVTTEIITFYFGKYALESTSPEVIIIAGGMISTLRAALYAFFGANMNSWLSLPIEMLQGLEYALVRPASLEIISQLSPPRLRATAIGVLSATESLSTGLGRIVGGLLYAYFGPIKMFLYMTWIGISALITYVVGLLMQKK